MNFRTQYNVEPAKGEELDDTVVTIPNQSESISSIMRKIELGLPITANAFVDLSDVAADAGVDRMFNDKIELLQANFLATEAARNEHSVTSKQDGSLLGNDSINTAAAAAAEKQGTDMGKIVDTQ